MAWTVWVEDSKIIAKAGEDQLVLGERPSLDDEDLEW